MDSLASFRSSLDGPSASSINTWLALAILTPCSASLRFRLRCIRAMQNPIPAPIRRKGMIMPIATPALLPGPSLALRDLVVVEVCGSENEDDNDGDANEVAEVAAVEK